MSRGLSKVQHSIIAILKHEAIKGRQWCDVRSLAYQVKYGLECWERDEPHLAPSESEKQSYWRSIRLLEQRGLIISRKRENVSPKLPFKEIALLVSV